MRKCAVWPACVRSLRPPALSVPAESGRTEAVIALGVTRQSRTRARSDHGFREQPSALPDHAFMSGPCGRVNDVNGRRLTTFA